MQCAVKVLVLPPGWEGPTGGCGGGGGGGRRARLAREVALTTTLRSPHIGGCEAGRRRKQPGPPAAYFTMPGYAVCTALLYTRTPAAGRPALPSRRAASSFNGQMHIHALCPHVLTPAVPTWDYTLDTIPIHGDGPTR